MNNIQKNAKKFILVLVLLILFNFCYPRYIVRADEESNTQSQESISKTIGDIGEEADNYNYTAENAGDRGGWLDLSTNFASLLFFMERGVIGLVNDIFSDEEHKFSYTVTDLGDYNEIEIDVFISPESIIKGKYLLFNADIFDNVSNSAQDYFDDASDKDTISGRTALRNTISGWYTVLRTFSIVALLSVLVYVGIRMIISTVAQDKAKYKVMFKDWLVALCLLIAMHYIMIAILDMSSMIVDAIGTSGAAASQTQLVMEKIGTITAAPKGYDVTYNSKTTEDVRAIYVDGNNNLELYTIGDAYAYEFLLVAMLFYTILFAIKYLKREFTIMFLILLGPISCITYPIDKISDGKAQAFNKWFSEFLFQVIIQPFHLLIYIVLVGTATQLANDNLLYSIVCFAVMIPAEKFIKEMFGFRDKLGSPLGAMATGAMASQLYNKMKGGSSLGKKEKETDNSSSELPVKTKAAPLPGTEGNQTSLPQANRNNARSDEGATDTSNSPESNEPAEGGIDTSDNPELDEPAEGGIDTSDNPELDEPAEGGIDTSDNPELDEPAEGDIDTSDNPELDEPAEGGIDTSDNPELDEPAEGGIDTSNSPESNETAEESGNASGENTETTNERKGFQKGIDAVRDRHNRKVMKKYGTLNKKELRHKRGWRVIKGAGRLAGKTIRGATTLAGVAALGTLGFMTGQGTKGALAGAALGKGLGNKITKNSLVSKTGEYAGTFYNAASGKDTNKEKYKSNQNNIDRARRNFKERNGYLGSGKDIDKELENMYKMTTQGVNDSQIEDTMNEYYENMDLYKDIKDQDKREELAMGTAIQSAIFAQDYTKKDFNDPKKMEEAYNGLLNAYKNAGVKDDKVADAYVRKIMNGAGKLRGVNSIALPPETKRISIPNMNNFHGKWNFEETQEQQDIQLERFSTLQAELISEGGYSREDIDVIVKSCSGNSNIELVDSFELKVKYLTDSDVDKAARVHVEKREDTEGLTENQIEEKVKIEKIERLGVRDATGVNNEKTISKLREMEEKSGTTEFREIGGKAARGELSKNDKNNMSEKSLEMSDKYKSIVKADMAKENPNTSTKKKKSRK